MHNESITPRWVDAECAVGDLQCLSKMNMLVKRVWRQQMVVACGISAASLIFGLPVALSVFAGALISTISNGYFAHRVFRSNTSQAETLAAQIYIAEFLKIAMAAIGLAVMWIVIDGIIGIALIIGFLLVHLSAAFVATAANQLGDNGI